MAIEASQSGQIQEFLRVLRRRRWQIALPALFVLVFGIAFAVVVPKKYVVRTRVEIKEARNPFDFETRNRDQGGIAREKPNIEQHIIHFARIDSIVKGPLIEHFPEYEYADGGKRLDIVEAVMRSLEVETVEESKSGSTFYDITYKDVDKDRAERLLEELNSSWIEDVAQRVKAEMQREEATLLEAFDEADAEYTRLNDAWVEQCKKVGHNPASPPYQLTGQAGGPPSDFAFAQLNHFRQEQEANAGALLVAERELETARRQLREAPETVMVPQRQEGRLFTEDIEAGEAERRRLEAYLETLLPEHREYQKTRGEIEAIDRRIAELRERETAAGEVRVPQANPERTVLSEKVREHEKQVAALEESRDHIAERVAYFEQEVESRTDEFGILSMLWQEREEARVARELARTELSQKAISIRNYDQTVGDQYDIAQPPLASDSLREPSALLLVAFALFAGLGLGLCVALVAEYARNSYRTANELATVLALPVLGAIGEIVTSNEARRLRTQRLVVGVSSAVVLLGVGWMTYLYADESRQELLPVSVLRAIEDFRLMLM